jgi:hypothetical protein
MGNLGIVGDGAHQKTGGYHEGMDVLVAIDRYHPPATSHVGSTAEDYSARILRDRLGLTNDASANDVGNAWPNGGNAAWLKFNNALAAALPTDPRLSAIRAINYSPNGETKLRLDREHGFKVEASTDTVTTHTHIEFYRDTEGHREETLDRLIELAEEAISGGSMTTADDVWNYKVPAPDNATRSAVGVQKDLGDQRNALASKLGAIPTGYAKPNDGTYFGAFLGMLDAFAAGKLGNVSLTDEQVKQIADQVSAAIEPGATPEQVRAAVVDALNSTQLTAS